MIANYICESDLCAWNYDQTEKIFIDSKQASKLKYLNNS